MNPYGIVSVVKYLWIKNIRFGLRQRVVRHETDNAMIKVTDVAHL